MIFSKKFSLMYIVHLETTALLNYYSLLTLHPWPAATPQVSPSFWDRILSPLLLLLNTSNFVVYVCIQQKIIHYSYILLSGRWCFRKLVQLALFCLKWQIMSKCKLVCFYGDWNERSICRWWYLGTAAAAADAQESIPDARKKRNLQNMYLGENLLHN